MARIHALMGAIAGVVVGAFVTQLALLPVVLIVRAAGWSEFPNGAAVLLGVLLVVWGGVVGARIGIGMAAEFDRELAREFSAVTWSGMGWTLIVGSELVELDSTYGVQRFTEQLGRTQLLGSGGTWYLELPDETIRPLDGLEESEAAEIRAVLGRL